MHIVEAKLGHLYERKCSMGHSVTDHKCTHFLYTAITRHDVNTNSDHLYEHRKIHSYQFVQLHIDSKALNGMWYGKSCLSRAPELTISFVWPNQIYIYNRAKDKY